MFGLGLGEIAIILIVALLVFGPDRLPEMTKQAASFVRDLRKMVANARRDISVSVQDLGIDEEDLRTLRQLRNPKAFVRDKVLDGMDLDDLGLQDEPESPAKANGSRRTNEKPKSAEVASPTTRAGSQSDALYDPDAT